MEENKLDILKKLGTGFKVPEGYFSSLENEISSKIMSDNFPKKTGFDVDENYFDTISDTFFEKINTENPAKVPNDYFENLEDAIFEKIASENDKEQPKVIDFRERLKKLLIPISVAASLLLMITLNFKNNTQTTTTEVVSTEVVGTDVDTWIDEDYIALNSYEIAEVFADEINTDDLLFEDENLQLDDYLNEIDVEDLLLDN